MTQDGIFVGGGGKDYVEPRDLLLKLANRHGLITGATGTGKTVTLQILVEGLSAAGVTGAASVRRSTVWMRASNSRGSKGLGR